MKPGARFSGTRPTPAGRDPRTKAYHPQLHESAPGAGLHPLRVGQRGQLLPHAERHSEKVPGKPGDFITTNGMFDKLDNHRMTDEALDVYTYDSYPNFAYCWTRTRRIRKSERPQLERNLTEVRSICPHLRHYGTAVRRKRLEYSGWKNPPRSPATDDALGHAVHRARSNT